LAETRDGSGKRFRTAVIATVLPALALLGLPIALSTGASVASDLKLLAQADTQPGAEAEDTAEATTETGTPDQADQEGEPAFVVDMTDELTFEPATVTVTAGDTLEWRNPSSVGHTVTADPQKAADPDNVVLPEGAEPFDSGMIGPDGTFTYTFTVPGRYRYVCLPHEAAGMIGEVIVEETSGTGPEEEDRAEGPADEEKAPIQAGAAEETSDIRAEAASEAESADIRAVEIAPEPVETRSRPVVRGEYLFQASGCAECHTAPDGPPLAGGRRMATEFGVFHVPNITPDRETGIGGWSEQDFVRSMKDGLSPEGEPYFPAFPYPWYTRIYAFDLSDLWAYLKTVEPVRNAVPPHDLSFRFGQRALVHGWRLLDFERGPAPAHPARSRLWNRGSYLVNALAHCGACHTTKTSLGTYRDGMFLAGSDQIPGGHVAPNITPDRETGIGTWSEDDIVRLLETGETPDGGFVHGPMAEVVAQRTAPLTEEDRRAIVEYLVSLPPVRHMPGAERGGRAPDSDDAARASDEDAGHAESAEGGAHEH
jgi:plastocyanin